MGIVVKCTSVVLKNKYQVPYLGFNVLSFFIPCHCFVITDYNTLIIKRSSVRVVYRVLEMNPVYSVNDELIILIGKITIFF